MSTQNKSDTNRRSTISLNIRQMCIFAMLGTIMFLSKLLMEALPNIHMIGMLTMVYTLTFRRKALIPIYIYVFLNGLFAGFSLWWIPYLYIWTILWAITMLLPKNMNKKLGAIVYPAVCCIHGLCFGILYAPLQAVMFGLDFDGMIAWIIAGFPFDLTHGAGNLVLGLLIIPLTEILKRLDRKSSRKYI